MRSVLLALPVVLPVLLPVLWAGAGAQPAAADEVVVFAAASMKTALDPVAADFGQATGHSVTISYAGSSVLAKQILAGAPADLFISASQQWMDAVAAEGLVVPGSRTDLLGNRLVLVAHDRGAAPLVLDEAADIPARLAGGKLAMALVESVPVGQYGKEALGRLGLWEAVAPSVAQADNARAALALVASGEAPYGIVYATDAAADPGVHVVGVFPEDSHTPIRYPVAVMQGSAEAADHDFLAALRAPAAASVFADNGFAVLP